VRVVIVAAALALAGCGGSSDSADKTAPFVGPWTVTGGTLTGMCAGLPMPFTQQLAGGQQTITKNADGSVNISLFPNCNVILDVNATVATLRATTPPQSCMFAFDFMGTPLQVMGTFTAGNFTVTGETATFSYTGNAVAGPLNCPVMGMGTSKKGAAPDGGGAAPADGGATPADTGSIPDGP
jgi:hypothetical protein